MIICLCDYKHEQIITKYYKYSLLLLKQTKLLAVASNLVAMASNLIGLYIYMGASQNLTYKPWVRLTSLKQKKQESVV